MKRRRNVTAGLILIVSDDGLWLDRVSSAFGVSHVVTHHVRAGAIPFARFDASSPAGAVVFGFRDLADRDFRAVLRSVQARWPGIPTLACTVLAADNLVYLKDILLSDLLDIRTSAAELVAKVRQLTDTVDMSAISAWLREAPGLPRSVASGLAFVLAADPPPRTAAGLARRIGVGVSTLRRDYKPIADATGMSLPDLLHALLLIRVAAHRAHGHSLAVACMETGIDSRTATTLALRLGGSGPADNIQDSLCGYFCGGGWFSCNDCELGADECW
jgi:hypothetical protein